MSDKKDYELLNEDIETVLNYIGTNIILNFARRDDTYSLNNKERLAYMRLSKFIGRGYEHINFNGDVE